MRYERDEGREIWERGRERRGEKREAKKKEEGKGSNDDRRERRPRPERGVACS